ncbi:MAG TPA: hypothetical protein VM243_03365 [Phycisphaerae bacterium]|nr:hypothetical protein [Phycisphaerae bacterium]
MSTLLVFLILVVIVGLISVTFFLFQINAKLEKIADSGGMSAPPKQSQ